MQGWAEHGYLPRAAEWLRPGKGHDRTLIRDHFAAVADGATPLGPDWPDPGPFAEQALWELSRSATLARRQVPAVFGSAIDATQPLAKAKAKAEAGDPGPTCAVAAAWLDADQVNVGVLGDCLALIQTWSGTVTVLTDPTVSRFDQRAGQVHEGDQPTALRRHRALANSAQGYWIYGSAPEAADHVISATLPLAQVRTVFLCTDGLRRVPALREAFAGQKMATPEPTLLDDVLDSVRSRSIAGAPVEDLDDDAAVLLSRGSAHCSHGHG
jgi:Protein phosphatase 2C